MTVTATSYVPIVSNGNGATTDFTVTFQFYELLVTHIDSSDTETPWVENTHYTVTGGNGSTGTVTVITTTLAIGEKLRIERQTAKDQPRDYDLDNAVLEAALQASDDRLTMIMQELDYDNRRRPAISKAVYTGPVDFPPPSTGAILSWGVSGHLVNASFVDFDGVAISALATTGSLDNADLLPLYDVSAGGNASITWENIKTQILAMFSLGDLAALNSLPDDHIATVMLSDGVVTTDKIGNIAVTPAKLSLSARSYRPIQNHVTAPVLYAASADREILPLETDITTHADNAGVLISAMINMEAGDPGVFYIKRNGTEIGSAPTAGSRTSGLAGTNYDADSTSTIGCHYIEYFDEDVGVAGTYTYTFHKRGENTTLALNRTSVDGDDFFYERVTSTVLLTEYPEEV